MDSAYPRYSTSDALLEVALEHGSAALECETQLIRVRDLAFRHCEGYYSKAAQACTWPCSITQMDSADQMERVYEGVVFWADAILVASPIRWGSASSLYFKMIERMNCIQNQVTIRDNVLIRNKVAAFIITGGQDNIQAVAGQMLVFFTELGFDVPQFPFIAHSRGWSAEDMERNVGYVQRSAALREGARALAERTVLKARDLIGHDPVVKTERAGRKAHRMEIVEFD
jgi:multimeric flavodoxin WrbA